MKKIIIFLLLTSLLISCGTTRKNGKGCSATKQFIGY